MNRGERKQYKPRKCNLTELQIEELAGLLKTRAYTCGEIIGYVQKHFHYKTSLFLILSVLDARNYKCAQYSEKTKEGNRTLYKIFTDADYERIEKEHRENAKRRLLAAVSY